MEIDDLGLRTTVMDAVMGGDPPSVAAAVLDLPTAAICRITISRVAGAVESTSGSLSAGIALVRQVPPDKMAK